MDGTDIFHPANLPGDFVFQEMMKLKLIFVSNFAEYYLLTLRFVVFLMTMTALSSLLGIEK